MGIANHRKQRMLHAFTVNHPVGIEYFMAAMFGVGLREHHQLHVRGIAPDTGEVLNEVFNFIRRQGQAKLLIRCLQRRAPILEDIHHAEWRRYFLLEQRCGCFE